VDAIGPDATATKTAPANAVHWKPPCIFLITQTNISEFEKLQYDR